MSIPKTAPEFVEIRNLWYCQSTDEYGTVMGIGYDKTQAFKEWQAEYERARTRTD